MRTTSSDVKAVVIGSVASYAPISKGFIQKPDVRYELATIVLAAAGENSEKSELTWKAMRTAPFSFDADTLIHQRRSH